MFVLDLESLKVERVLEGWMKTCPHWSPDSRWLAITTAEGYVHDLDAYKIVLLDTATKQVVQTGLVGAGRPFHARREAHPVLGRVHTQRQLERGRADLGQPVHGRRAQRAPGPGHPLPERGRDQSRDFARRVPASPTGSRRTPQRSMSWTSRRARTARSCRATPSPTSRGWTPTPTSC